MAVERAAWAEGSRRVSEGGTRTLADHLAQASRAYNQTD